MRSLLRLAPVAATVDTSPLPRRPRVEIGSWDPRGHLESVIWADLFGLDTVDVTRAEAMAVPAIARARHIVTSTIARVPLREYRVTTAPQNDTTPQLADPQPVWLRRTDSPISPWHRMVLTVDDQLFYGESLWRCDRDVDGRVIRVEHVPYAEWDVDPDTGAILLDGRQAPARSVIHLPGPHEGLLSFGRRSIRMATQLDATAAETAARPFRVELHNESDLDLTEAEISATVNRARAALADNGGILYTSRHVKATLHAVSAEALLVEGRNASALDVARLVGLPASILDASGPGSMTYTNSQAKLAEAVDFGLGMYMAALSGRLSLDDVAPAGSRITFALEELLSPALSAAGLTPNGDAPA